MRSANEHFDATLLLAAAAAGDQGQGATGSAARWAWIVLRELGRSQAPGFLLDCVLWTLLGALLGLVLAVVSCVIFTRLGWYDLRIRFARGLRWTAFVVVVVITAGLAGVVGFWTGAIRGSERVLTRSHLAADVFPKVADVIADGMGWIQARATLPADADTNELTARLEAFRAGQWELHASQFLQQLDEFKDSQVGEAVRQLETSAGARVPQLREGVGARLLHQLLHGLGRLMIEKKAASELKSWGADRVYFAIREQLRAEAGKAGNPDTISHRELSGFLIAQGIVPALLKPIRATARAQQWPLLFMALSVMVIPPLCLRLARRRPSVPNIPSGSEHQGSRMGK